MGGSKKVRMEAGRLRRGPLRMEATTKMPMNCLTRPAFSWKHFLFENPGPNPPKKLEISSLQPPINTQPQINGRRCRNIRHGLLDNGRAWRGKHALHR